ncbi:polar amino acid transport system permease protein [Arcanobacterium wilhelmae]|uniref:Polar amino acid transport system permease protein n=1 Tax=Arcanobacterium wilhelmae TaxID=1803177 RepID=A0ABT9N9Q0_9ACTO|nr:amino acid ABC transporter permease [Arcanobacterium wilhelmae]MDP9800435.1 polar amino acid transport system permease protein [Arcanobacterium wilhelmae]
METKLIEAVPVRHWGRWVSAVVVGLLAVGLAYQVIVNPNFHWDVVAANLLAPDICQAVGFTLALTVGAMVLGVLLAVTMAVMRRSENPVLRGVATFYIWFFRGTPIYTQLIFWGLMGTLWPTMTFGIPFTSIEFFTVTPGNMFGGLNATMFFYAVVGLGVNEGAYLAEIVRSGLNSVDAGQEEAAKALGMSSGQVLRRVVLPQAMRVIVPPTGNETISMLKTTSLVTAVPLTLELTAITSAKGSSSFLPVPFLLVAAVWYLVITSILMVGQYYLEKYYGRGANRDAGKVGRRASAKAKVSRQAAITASGTTTDDPFIEYTP